MLYDILLVDLLKIIYVYMVTQFQCNGTETSIGVDLKHLFIYNVMIFNNVINSNQQRGIPS